MKGFIITSILSIILMILLFINWSFVNSVTDTMLEFIQNVSTVPSPENEQILNEIEEYWESKASLMKLSANHKDIDEIETLCGKKIIHTVKDAEHIGPKNLLDIIVVAPCTGNTLGKLANGITDTPVCMATKAHLRSDRPLVITLASNDALSANLRNIGTLLSRKNVYFTPLRQDDPVAKPHSLVADFDQVPDALGAALEGKQLRPLFL